MPSGGPGDHPLTDILLWKLAVYGDKTDNLIRNLATLTSYRELEEWWQKEIGWDASREAVLAKATLYHNELLKRSKSSGWETRAIPNILD